ncbi:MAG: glycosyl transferase family 2 [Rhodospirillaceae bacterium]|nr:glycosyl transferase family 2 [Rhodospirillaceae bacterium]OUT77003.1 MAG: glycosyl transferase family 2 [Rhodospirillaceae bacterium TMED23]|tara:strand:+ start:575 stop:1576 length:1002 start_codon:yes stop_codon:yes gene_type:complete
MLDKSSIKGSKENKSARECLIAVVIPCYREKSKILDVLLKIDSTIDKIIVIDDACPEKTGEYVAKNSIDPRVLVVTHSQNQGVGGATISGYKKALELNSDVIVKMDGDGQMDTKNIGKLIKPILNGDADYTKGNRFYSPDNLSTMPKSRLIGNLLLSFASKMSSGYWRIFDPTNGFTAIHNKVLKELPLDKISKDYFFESDMLFRLNITRAVVCDIPMKAIYADETSTLKISKILMPFSKKHIINVFKRITYNYFLRDFSIASIELLASIILILFGVFYGTQEWLISSQTGIPATAGTVIIAALPILVGSQLFISFLNFDVNYEPDKPIHNKL